MLNVHSLEDNLAEYPGLEEDIVKIVLEQGVGFVQLRCPETRLHGVERLPMPKDTYDKPKIRENYRKQAEEEVLQLKEFVKKGAKIVAIVGAEASPSCGVHYVAKWRLGVDPKDRKWPETVDFVPGRGVYLEELEKLLNEAGIKPKWIGVPGISMKKAFPKMFKGTLKQLNEL
jgi:predicted secreted protein